MDKDLLRTIFLPTLDEAIKNMDANKIKLAHYTSFEVALQIIEGEAVWMRDVSRMNDIGEVRYGIQAVDVFMSETADRKMLVDTLDAVHPDQGAARSIWPAMVGVQPEARRLSRPAQGLEHGAARYELVEAVAENTASQDCRRSYRGREGKPNLRPADQGTPTPREHRTEIECVAAPLQSLGLVTRHTVSDGQQNVPLRKFGGLTCLKRSAILGLSLESGGEGGILLPKLSEAQKIRILQPRLRSVVYQFRGHSSRLRLAGWLL